MSSWFENGKGNGYKEFTKAQERFRRLNAKATRGPKWSKYYLYLLMLLFFVLCYEIYSFHQWDLRQQQFDSDLLRRQFDSDLRQQQI
jgi:hypothetical protein